MSRQVGRAPPSPSIPVVGVCAPTAVDCGPCHCCGEGGIINYRCGCEEWGRIVVARRFGDCGCECGWCCEDCLLRHAWPRLPVKSKVDVGDLVRGRLIAAVQRRRLTAIFLVCCSEVDEKVGECFIGPIFASLFSAGDAEKTCRLKYCEACPLCGGGGDGITPFFCKFHTRLNLEK